MLDYYAVAGEAGTQIGNHSGLVRLVKLCTSASRVLDVGCGEGSRLNTLLPDGKTGWGIDISQKAIKLAKKHYPKHHFFIADATNIPLKKNSFDLTYSAFALEHTVDPKKFISEMIRVTKPGGKIAILCPNYGAPNRRSPVSQEKPVNKLIRGIYRDIFPVNSLNWTFVHPRKTYSAIDEDTTVEPYLYSLKLYLASVNLNVLSASSVWDQEKPTLNPRKLTFLLLGKLGLFPFNYWGPQLFIVAQKP